MSFVPKETQGTQMHGGNSAVTSRELSQWVNQYNDITVTGKTNFNNDISISYNSLNYLNVSIDSEANITLDITNSYNNNCSEFIFNNKIKANNGLTIKGDTIIGEDIDDLLIINSTVYSNSNLTTGSNLTNNMNITGDCIIGEDLSNILVVNSTSEFINNTSFKKNVTIQENTTIEGNLTIIGNLSSGTQTSAPQISAPITGLNTDSNTIANTYDSGMLIVRTSPNPNAFIGWDESEGKFIMGTGNISPNDTSSNLSITTGDLQIANIISTGSFTTSSGNITTSSGNITTSSGNITTTNGNFTTTSGNFTTTSGNITTTNGNFTTTSGNFTTSSGNITTSSGNIATTSGTIQTNNLIVDGNVGIGVTNPTEKLDINGNLHIEGDYICIRSDSNNDGNTGKPALYFSEDNYNSSDSTTHNDSGNVRIIYDGYGQSGDDNFIAIQGRTAAKQFNNTLLHCETGGNVGIGTNNPTEKLEVNGKLKVNDDITSTDNIISHKFIYKNITGYENLYYWAGRNAFDTSTEPFVGNSFVRITYTPGIVIMSHNGASGWNGASMFRLDNASTDTIPPSAFTTSLRHMKLRMPVKPGISNSFYVKGITGDRWQSYVVYVNNENNNGSYGYYRLEARSNSGIAGTLGTSSWFGPNGEESIAENGYHEWVMFYIPQYIIDDYCYTTTDNKSKYRKNINIYMIQGDGANSNENYISGFAMRENPLDIVIINSKAMHFNLNGGNSILHNSDDGFHEHLGWIDNNNENILIPIPNKKNQSIYGYPNFILGYVPWLNYDTYHHHRVEVQMQSSNNGSTLKNLGQFTRYNVGVFGLFLKERHKHPLGLIVPKLEYNSEFITIIQGRPYLRLKFIKIEHSLYLYFRGFYTELLDYTDNHINMNMDGYEPVTY